MEFLGKLGIDINLLLAQIVNFVILLAILKKFLYEPIIKRIEEDEKKLTEAQQQKSALEKERQEFEKYKFKQLDQSHQKAEEIIDEAESIAKKIRSRAHEETEEEKVKVVEQIKKRLKELNDEKPNQSK